MTQALALVLAASIAPGYVRDADGGAWRQDAADAGAWAAPLYGDCPDAPPAEQLDGGSWLVPDARARRLACLMETCEAHRRLLAAEPPPVAALSTGSLVVAAVVAVAGLVLGAYVGWSARSLLR